MKFTGILEEHKNKEQESSEDYLDVSIDYGNGKTGVVTVSRARYNRIMFEQNKVGSVLVTDEFLSTYRELVIEEERVERSLDFS
jgi:hypothetical protein